jgi:hypothetical protein
VIARTEGTVKGRMRLGLNKLREQIGSAVEPNSL